MLKTNTVKRTYRIQIDSETESLQTIIAAESLSDALRLLAEKQAGKDRASLKDLYPVNQT